MTDLDRLKELYPGLSPDVTIQSSTGNVTDCHSDRVEASSGTPVRRNTRNELHESEADLQQKAIDYLHLKGYHVAHFRPARVETNGKVTWRTAVSADGQGFLDLCIVRYDLRFVEVKSSTGQLSIHQQNWIRWLIEAKIKWFVLHPENWDEFVRWAE